MSENETEQLMRLQLEALDFKVERIETAVEGGEQRADYRATDGTDSFIIEVKSKEDSPGYKALLDELDERGIAVGSTLLTADNAISRVIRKAAKQLANTPARESDFRLIWFACLGHDASFVLEQAELTVYGSREVMTFDQGSEDVSVKTCHFYGHGEFWRCRHVDAIALFGYAGWKLRLNPFSPRRDALSRTRLCSILGKAVCDPIAREAAREDLFVDEDVDRKDEAAVQQFLCRKYGLQRVDTLNPHHDQGLALVRRR